MTEGLHRFYGARDIHFLTFSCYHRQPFFNDPALCDLFLKILERVRLRYRIVVLGYVVMPEHVHLLVSEPQRETLSIAIQALKLGVARSLQCAGANPSFCHSESAFFAGEESAPGRHQQIARAINRTQNRNLRVRGPKTKSILAGAVLRLQCLDGEEAD